MKNMLEYNIAKNHQEVSMNWNKMFYYSKQMEEDKTGDNHQS